MLDFGFTVDIEPTNRCNAKCHFCPRDQTPHQGLMTPEVFDQALVRTLEFREEVRGMDDTEVKVRFGEVVSDMIVNDVKVSLCGLGEPLLNRHTPTFVKQIRDAGLSCIMSSNGALLDRARGEALLDAGLQRIMINVGDIDDDYEDVYGLPFEKTRERVTHFARMAEGRCEVWIVLVDYRQDRAHLQEMRSYWQDRGIPLFMEFEVMNRGGALFVDHMQYEQYGELAAAEDALAHVPSDVYCVAPYIGAFVGYDGIYYLCCSDWRKEVGMGDVFERSITDIMRDKFEKVMSREPICKTCNHDPTNRVIDDLRGIAAGEIPDGHQMALIDEMVNLSAAFSTALERLQPGVTAPVAVAAPKRRIPIQAV
jgi:MoaA/NifB/PqqE/SkfB family radical SAM enzyme